MIQILPSYFSFDDKKLGEFMSELGINSEVQRKIFNMIISLKSAYLDYNDFVSRAEGLAGTRNFEAELLSLMRKIKVRCYGMVLSKRQLDGTKSNYAIVLVEEKDPIFYYYLMLDLFDNLYSEERISFLTLKAVEKKDIELPHSVVEVIKKEDICDRFFAMNHQQKVVYLFQSMDESFPVPGLRLKLFLEFCVLYLRDILQLSAVKDWLSRISSLNIRNVSQILQEDDLALLISLCSEAVSRSEDFLQVAKLDPKDDFFKAFEIVKTYFENEENEKKEKADLERLFLKNMKEIADKLALIPGMINPDQISRTIGEHAKYFSNLSDFKARALTYLKTNGDCVKYDIPILYELGGSYIHRRALFPYFKKEFATSSIKVKEHLILLARNALEQSISTVFSSQVSIEKEMALDLSTRFPFVYEILSKPKLLSEYIFYFLREIQGVKSIEEIKQTALLYAPLSDPLNIPLVEIYNVSLEDVFEKAYRSLSLIKKFWYYIIGRYHSYLEKVKSLDRIRIEAKLISLEHENNKYSADWQAKEQEDYKKTKGSSGRGSRLQASSSAKKKLYTKSERDKAWYNFGRQIKDE